MNPEPPEYSVSVVIPAYNIAEYIGRAIESVLAQTRRADEIIVVDDGSTDGTAEVIKRYLPQVKYIYQENRGLAGARNTGIRESTSTWVAFLDGDDEWLPQCLELQMGLLERNPHLVWTGANCITCLCDENRQAPISDSNKAKEALNGKDYFDDFFKAFVKDYRGNGDTMIIRRDILFDVGLFREHLRSAEDIDMWMRLAIKWPAVGYVCEPVAIYHLNRAGSLMNAMKIRTRMQHIRTLLADAFVLANQTGQYERFRPAARFHIIRCIRGWLFSRELSQDIRDIARQFTDLLEPHDKVAVALLTLWPWATEKLLRSFSFMVRTLRLRKQAIARPQNTSSL